MKNGFFIFAMAGIALSSIACASSMQTLKKADSFAMQALTPVVTTPSLSTELANKKTKPIKPKQPMVCRNLGVPCETKYGSLKLGKLYIPTEPVHVGRYTVCLPYGQRINRDIYDHLALLCDRHYPVSCKHYGGCHPEL